MVIVAILLNDDVRYLGCVAHVAGAVKARVVLPFGEFRNWRAVLRAPDEHFVVLRHYPGVQIKRLHQQSSSGAMLTLPAAES